MDLTGDPIKPIPAKFIPIESLDLLDPSTFDWDAFVGTYKDRALITRLLHVSSLIINSPRPPSSAALELAREAATRAIAPLKETWDHATYKKAVDQIDRALHPDRLHAPHSAGPGGEEPMDIDAGEGRKGAEHEGVPDVAWIEEVTRRETDDNARLVVELNGYMSNLIKESIRLTYLAMAQLALKTGSLTGALRAYTQVREFSSGSAQQLDLGLGIIHTALVFNDTGPVVGNVSKVEAALDRLHPASENKGPVAETTTNAQVQQNRVNAQRSAAVRRSVIIKLRVARGLHALAQKDYTRAARELGEVGEEGGLQDWEGQAISTADLAFITAICALATGSRDHIRRVLLNRPSFTSAVDDSQTWLVDLVRAYVDAHYGDALTMLHKAEPHMLLNPFLAPSAADLMQRIRTRMLMQYITPFSTVRIATMAQSFGADEDAMLAEVSELAQSGRITAKIDLVDRILTLTPKDVRADAFRHGLENGAQIQAMIEANMFRMRLKAAGVVVDPGKELKQQDGKPPGPSRQGSWAENKALKILA